MDLPEDAAAAIDMVQAAHEEFTGDPDSFQKLIEDAEKPLYPSCSSHTKVSTLIRLFNIKEKGGWSGMEYEKIHACPNDFLLFRKDYKDDNTCRTCGASRWKKAPSCTSKGVPEKVMWYFSPIPIFQRMFRSPKTSKHLIYHSLPRVEDGKLRHPVNSPAWKLVDNKWPEFAKEPRNLRLALSTDGFNPNSSVGGNYSCWPVMLAIYNFPLKLCKFIMLTMLISGPKQPGNDIDVYLAPLIEDLQKLWDEGVEVFDAYKEENFNLKVVLLWTISDFPAYANLSGCPKGGYNACPICAERTSSIRLKYSGKNVYQSHRKFLPRKHKFRLDKKAFHGQQELGTSPKPYNGEEVLRQVEDVIHTEKNIGESIVGTLLNVPKKTKDGYNARKDLEDLGMRPELAPKENGKKAYLPPACFRLKKEEKIKFCKTLSELKVPEGYCSNFKNRVSMTDLKLYGLKSHDYHMLMQQFLLLAIRSILPEHVLKGYVRNRNRIEGCIAEGYIAEEAVEFCTEYFKNVVTIGIPIVGTATTTENFGGTSLLSDGKTLSKSTFADLDVNGPVMRQAHQTVLNNTEVVEPYFELHMSYLKEKFPHETEKWLEKQHCQTFQDWLHEKRNKFSMYKQSYSNCSIVISTRERDIDECEVEESLALEGNPSFENVVPEEGSFDIGDDSQYAYMRDNNEGIWIEDISKGQKKTHVQDDNPMDEDESSYDDSSMDDGYSSMEIEADDDD
ncbi:uncharacterized protein LOC113337940 [Papaver somniferum]|uniref:uncharacterized protein LOC113337940 n=1 Tax=Papaver somniferum TaxID=3469 RepID=UPI000E6F621E|nr:uncharacterized protein LOC113337940 [Papaver somniferum]